VKTFCIVVGSFCATKVYWFLLWLNRVVRVLLLRLCFHSSLKNENIRIFNVARPGQLPSTHFKYFTSFACCTWRTLQLSIMFIFKSSIARQWINIRHYVYCLSVLRTISCLAPVQARVYCTSSFTCTFFTRAFHTCVVYMPIPLPTQSIWCTLHAISITCTIHTPKMTSTHSFITRTLSHPVLVS